MVYDTPDSSSAWLSDISGTPHSLTIQFSSAEDNFNPIVSHTVACWPLGEPLAAAANVTVAWPDSNETTIEGLDPGVEYSCFLAATNDAGTGSFSEAPSSFWTGIEGNLSFGIPGALSYDEEATGGGVARGQVYGVELEIFSSNGGILGPQGANLTVELTAPGCLLALDFDGFLPGSTSLEIFFSQGSQIETASCYLMCNTLFGEGVGPRLRFRQSETDQVRS